MTASETIFFTRYFGILVGEKVDPSHKAWKLYQLLREIVSIVTAPFTTNSHLLQLSTLISEHHRLYIELYGDLSAKHHFTLHYFMLFKKYGPLIKICTARGESKHRKLKQALEGCCSHINVLKSLMIRYQLSEMHTKFLKYKECYISYTETKNIYDDLIELNNVTINDVTYKPELTILVKITSHLPEFGIIKNIFLKNNEIIFEYVPLYVVGFDKHLCAYNVLKANDKVLIEIKYKDIPLRTPCVLYKKFDQELFVVTRHIF